MIYVYILKSKQDNGYYIGITKNLNDRIIKHNNGSVRSTKVRKPFELVHKGIFESYSFARKREIEIKFYKGGNNFKKLIGV